MRKEYASEAINKLHNEYKYLTLKGFIEKNRESLRAAHWVISCSGNLDHSMGEKTETAWEEYKKAGFSDKKAFENFMECVYKLEADLDTYFKSNWKTSGQGLNKKRYVNEDIVKGFQSKQDYFNYQKLITLIEELNFNYVNNKVYSSCAVLRAILDHIPPILGKDNFKSVVSQYNWGGDKSSKQKAMKKLLEFKNTSDDVLHGQISDKSDIVDISYLPDKFCINTLLKECLESQINSDSGRQTVKKQKVKNGNIKTGLKIDFVEKKVSWANYAVDRWVWSSFRMTLSINNFHNKSAEYIRAYLLAKSNEGKWEARNFVFQRRGDEYKSKPNEDFRIEPGYKETIPLFISPYNVREREQKAMPDIDKDTLKLVIETESGKTFTLPIKAGWISRG